MASMVPMMSQVKKLRAGGGAVNEFVFAWEREDGCCFRYVLPIPAGREHDPATQRLAERAVKFALWAAGGWRLHLAGPEAVCQAVEAAYSKGGARDFDRDMMFKAYGCEMEIRRCRPEEVPASKDSVRGAGISWKGCRIGFDLGASDFKIAAVQEGKVTFSDEFPWDPRNAADPQYHVDKLNEGLRAAAAHLPRVDAIGGSTAGIVVDNQIRVASLLRAVPADRYAEAQSMFRTIEKQWNVPVKVENDGDVTALAAYVTGGTTAVLGVAMGSSQAGGYLDRSGHITGRLNELAFTPVDFAPDAPADEWSGDVGVGAMYFSQQATNYLAGKLGIAFPEDMKLPERLLEVQRLMAAEDARAIRLYTLVGEHLGHSVPWYREFYDYDNLLMLGRVTSGRGGEIILATARETVRKHYPECVTVNIFMPDEKAKRLGQAVAAAALS